MFKTLKTEITYNQHYLYKTLFVTLLTLLPQFVLVPNGRYFTSLILLTLFLIFSANFSKMIFASFIILLNTLNLFYTNVAMHWGTCVNISSRLDTAVLSPTSETIEYLHTFVDYRDILIFIYSLLVIIVMFKLLFSHQHTFKTVKRIAIFLALILFIVLQNQEPLRLVKDYYYLSTRNHILATRTEFIKNYQLQKSTTHAPIYDKVIFILGESANKHFLTPYGYTKETTPFLSSLKKENKLIAFNTIATSNQTRFAVPMILTTTSVKDFEEAYTHSPSLVTAFKQNGYKTHWISSQYEQGEDEDFVTNIALESDFHLFVTQVYSAKKHSDALLLNYLQDHRVNKAQEFYLFHLIGSHFDYAERYTKDALLNPKADTTLKQYENSIFFSDYIIKEIVQHFEKSKQKLLFVYISDHGEVVTENEHGHGFEPVHKDEYEIPLLVYSNISNARIDELHDDNTAHFFNSESTYELVMYIAGLSDDKNISTASTVFGINPDNYYDYKSLEFYDK